MALFSRAAKTRSTPVNQFNKSVESADPTARETGALIASDKVEGTNVYRSDGEKIGHIERVMIDKQSGHTAYAVMNFGGFLGLGEESHPLPWSVLTYNPDLGGYEVNVPESQLRGAPTYDSIADWNQPDRHREASIFGYYGVPPYWI
jgi:hypothetical protein